MRKIMTLVEDTLIRPAWRARMLAAAQAPESMFTAVQHDESGLDRTVYVSEIPDHPAVIVDSRAGRNLSPDDLATVLAVGEVSGIPEVDRWLGMNADALHHFVQSDYDSVDFFAAMKKLNETVRLVEMANFRKGRFNAPVTFWIRPEPNPQPHEARVKCNANYTDRPTTDNFSIHLLPTAHLPDKDGKPVHNTGSVSRKDVEGMVRWIGQHQQTFLDFYFDRINQAELVTRLTAGPYS